MRLLLHLTFVIFIFTSCSPEKTAKVASEASKPNILILIADDVSFDSFGFVGGVAPDVTPNIDRLAGEGISFLQAFSTVAVCQPSRQSMLTGLIPNHYGSQGFFPIQEGTPTLPAILKEAGYMTGIIHKEQHLMPVKAFNWDFNNYRLGLTEPDGAIGRSPKKIASGFRKLIMEADNNDQPFFMVVGSADAHRPFHSDPYNKKTNMWGKGKVKISFPDPSRIYTPDEVTVTPALPDIPDIRKDLANYASSVRRLDDTVGECLKVLDEAGKNSNTIVIFVSDNGMPLAFGKFDTYMGSNHSPLLIRWPGNIEKGLTNEKHLVSLMDITPTLLEVVGLPIPSPMDGRSLLPFIQGKTPEKWRESIVFIRNQDVHYGDALISSLDNRPNILKELEEKGWKPSPDHKVEGTYVRQKEIRTIYDGRYGYIYNQCYREDGMEMGDLGAIVPYGGRSIRALNKAGKTNPALKARYEFFLLRAPEELYDWSVDPGSLNNLAEDPEYAEILNSAREGLLSYMESANDPVIEDFKSFIN